MGGLGEGDTVAWTHNGKKMYSWMIFGEYKKKSHTQQKLPASNNNRITNNTRERGRQSSLKQGKGGYWKVLHCIMQTDLYKRMCCCFLLLWSGGKICIECTRYNTSLCYAIGKQLMEF